MEDFLTLPASLAPILLSDKSSFADGVGYRCLFRCKHTEQAAAEGPNVDVWRELENAGLFKESPAAAPSIPRTATIQDRQRALLDLILEHWETGLQNVAKDVKRKSVADFVGTSSAGEQMMYPLSQLSAAAFSCATRTYKCRKYRWSTRKVVCGETNKGRVKFGGGTRRASTRVLVADKTAAHERGAPSAIGARGGDDDGGDSAEEEKAADANGEEEEESGRNGAADHPFTSPSAPAPPATTATSDDPAPAGAVPSSGVDVQGAVKEWMEFRFVVDPAIRLCWRLEPENANEEEAEDPKRKAAENPTPEDPEYMCAHPDMNRAVSRTLVVFHRRKLDEAWSADVSRSAMNPKVVKEVAKRLRCDILLTLIAVTACFVSVPPLTADTPRADGVASRRMALPAPSTRARSPTQAAGIDAEVTKASAGKRVRSETLERQTT